MSRQYKNGTCSCWRTVSKRIEVEDTRLTIGVSTSGHQYLQVGTNSPGRAISKRKVYCSYCPFCGCELIAEERNERETP